MARALESETPAEGQHAVAELLARLVGQDLMREILLEGSEGPEAGTAPLSVDDTHGHQVNASHAPVLMVRAGTFLALSIEDVI
jgi:hypothetical protein